jgi:hypothetical protein
MVSGGFRHRDFIGRAVINALKSRSKTEKSGKNRKASGFHSPITGA